MSCLLLIVIFGCEEDLLNQVNPNSITPDTFWQTAEDAERGVIGAYSPITGVQFYGRMFVFASDYRDDIINGFAISARTAPGRFQGTSDVAAVRVSWQEGWKAIVRANEVLFNVPNIEMNDAQKNAILGEALFIRSFIYHDFVNLWLNVPLITTPLTVEEANSVFQATPNEVWAQLVTDLEQARDWLPPTRSENELGRATWGAASALLAKVYLITEQYGQAATVLREIRDSGLYSLVDDYGDNFRSSTENNTESVFEFQMSNDGNTGWVGDAPNTGRANSVVPDFAPQGFTNQNGMRINDWALDLFLDEQTVNGETDPRAFYTLFWDTDETTNYEGQVLSSRTYKNLTYQEARPGDTNIYGNKYVFADAEDGNEQAVFHRGDMNWRVIRYADVLLYLAEAIMEGGSSPTTQEAVDAVNLVRARADMPEYDLSMTWQDVMDERVKELALEHYRYYDLLRWDMVKERIVDIPGIKSESGGVGAYQPGREYMDIPQVDLDINPNLQRNPGY
ncbi:RagB/SusD family nutrient uptake outer membrane protein [Maribacter sp. 2210JD10-5]|uniref:RagB/SusD family nutrient uptake outer membrane protein n=1 Tax=Maribacter sp. 2210JD10-5 TaxID=3386272 RepID=UPI0039BD6A5C